MKYFKTFLLSLSMLYCISLPAKATALDTLHVIHGDEFLRYPFGMFQDFKSFKNQDISVLRSKISYVRPYQDEKKEATRTFNVGGSFVRFYANKDTKKIETINAIILNKGMPLQNDIMIGMDRSDFLKKLNISENASSNARVVELSSKTGDIHHYYDFQNDRLVRITILSKLFYQKE
ncbi:hypothetical protein [Pedobacter psychrodurus]|uniref:hypothetical protein n=1 Tax=Pedobacter psychrodurus TaxID=2530456 RepID=UPI00292FE8BE|nr:hypothetical protein [Pedobacter psychrodurus]